MFNFIELQKKQIYHTVRQIIRQMTYKNMRKYRKEELCWCKSGKLYGDCHMEFDKRIDI